MRQLGIKYKLSANTAQFVSAVLAVSAVVTLLVFELGIFDWLTITVNSADSVFSNVLSATAITTSLLSAVVGFNANRLHQLLMEKKYEKLMLIYSESDKKTALEIKERLIESNVNVDLISEKVPLGGAFSKSLQQEIMKSIDEGVMAGVLISKNFKTSKWANWELDYAMEALRTEDKQTSPIIPILVDEVELPTNLKHLQYIRYWDDDQFRRFLYQLPSNFSRILGNKT